MNLIMTMHTAAHLAFETVCLAKQTRHVASRIAFTANRNLAVHDAFVDPYQRTNVNITTLWNPPVFIDPPTSLLMIFETILEACASQAHAWRTHQSSRAWRLFFSTFCGQR